MKVLAYCTGTSRRQCRMGALAGKAALQLSRGASSPGMPRLAYTLARLIGILERQHEQDTLGKSSGRVDDIRFTPMTLLVIDEAGMMDTPTLHRVVSRMPLVHVCFWLATTDNCSLSALARYSMTRSTKGRGLQRLPKFCDKPKTVPFRSSRRRFVGEKPLRSLFGTGR